MMDKSWRQNIETTILNLKEGSVGLEYLWIKQMNWKRF